jgi:hypothetical protein
MIKVIFVKDGEFTEKEFASIDQAQNYADSTGSTVIRGKYVSSRKKKDVK